MNRVKIIYSSECPAGRNVARALRDEFGFGGQENNAVNKTMRLSGSKPVETPGGLEANGGADFVIRAWGHANRAAELVEVPWRLSTECEEMARHPEIFASELLVFASRHRAQSGAPCFTAHFPGNFGADNGMGGNAFELGVACARAGASILRWLSKNPLGTYAVCREATHHGPTSLPWPVVFAELGSTEAQWNDGKAAAHLAKAIAHAVENYGNEGGEVCTGFGGTHYCPKLGAMEKNGKLLLGHVASKYALDAMTPETLRQCFDKSAEKPEKAVVDWKGCSAAQRGKVLALLKENGIEFEKA